MMKIKCKHNLNNNSKTQMSRFFLWRIAKNRRYLINDNGFSSKRHCILTRFEKRSNMTRIYYHFLPYVFFLSIWNIPRLIITINISLETLPYEKELIRFLSSDYPKYMHTKKSCFRFPPMQQVSLICSLIHLIHRTLN